MNTASTPQPDAAPVKPTTSMRRPVLRRLLQALLCLGICIITLIALFDTVMNWRGKRAWAAYQKTMDAKGEVLDYRRLVPPPVPDDQNFAMTPSLAVLVDFHPGTQTLRDTNAVQAIERAFNKLPADLRRGGDWRKGERTDLALWVAAFNDASDRAAGKGTGESQPPPTLDRSQAATALLAQLEGYNPILDELRAASHRPYSRFNLCYDCENPAAILLPHLAKLRHAARILSLRASVHIALGRAEAALDDILLALHLVDSIRNEPTLISHLVRCAILRSAMQPIWEGFADRQWSETHIEALNQRLGKFDFLADDLNAMRAERAFGNAIIAYMREKPRMAWQLGSSEPVSENGIESLLVTLIPRGWFYLEQVNYNRLFEERLLPGIDLGARRADVEAMRRNEAVVAESASRGFVANMTSFRLLSNMLLPALGRAHQRFVYTQSMIDQTRIACALERHRLATGELPPSLADLAPRFLDKLPHDIISGQPLKYSRIDPHGFRVYSVGWNATDDGGEVALDHKGKSNETVDTIRGDWVWLCP